ncbi:MAG: C4-dicarboxylate ABC transporter, partial [Paracoccaceae bacterium]
MSRDDLKSDAATDLVAQVDTGARMPDNWQGKLILWIAFIWAVFQLYIASNLPFWLTENTGVNVIVESFLARRIHMSFALLLAALAFPLFKRAPHDRIPWYDWCLPLLGIGACMYAVVNYDDISVRSGTFLPKDTIAATVGLLVLAVSIFRTLGLPLLIVASAFVLYVFFGDANWLPEAMQWKGA